MTEQFEYHVDGRKLPAVLKQSSTPIDVEELCALIKRVTCPLASADALTRTVVLETVIGKPLYTTEVLFRDPMVLGDVSAERDSIHLDDKSTTVVRESVGDMKLGDAYVIVGRRTMQRDGQTVSIGVVLAIVPWFAANSISFERGRVPWSETIPNVLYNMLDKVAQLRLMRCQRIRPFMPFADGDTSHLSEEQLRAKARQILSFLLRWHQTRTAVHPSIVKQGFRCTDKKDVARESLKLGDELDEWRDMQLRAALNNRSFVFFGVASPRVALFESQSCWTALGHVVNTFMSPMYAAFVVNEMLDVMRFVVRTEIMAHGELAVYYFARDYLKKMCEGLEEAERDHFNQCVEAAAAQTTGGPKAPQISAAFVGYYTCMFGKATSEPLDMRIDTISELRAQAHADGSLNEAEIRYLSCVDELDLESADEKEREQFRANMENNIVCVSHNLFAGSEIISKALFADKHGNTSASAIVKRGRRYMMAKSALELAVSLTRALLNMQTSAEANGAVMSKLEHEFSQASPHAGGLYPESDHATAFDDIAIGSDDFREVRASLDAHQLREFQAGARTSLPLPADFNMARNRGLLVSDDELYNVVALCGALNSKRHGNVPVHKLAVRGVMHTLRCLKRKSEACRAHIEIEFDTDGDDAKRSDRLIDFERQSRPTTAAAFEEATRQIVSGNREPMNDVEDVIGNMYENNALPLCVRAMARKVQHREGIGYLQNTDRVLFYRLMKSLDVPEMSDQAVLRFLYKNMPPAKIRELNPDATHNWPNIVAKKHREEADKHVAHQLRLNKQVSQSDALKATTCAPNCWGLIGPKENKFPSRCPFRELSDAALFDLLRESGTDDDGIEAILKVRGKYGYQCKLQFVHSRPPETRDTKPFTTYTQDAFFQHPHQYMLAAADHLLRHREARAHNDD